MESPIGPDGLMGRWEAVGVAQGVVAKRGAPREARAVRAVLQVGRRAPVRSEVPLGAGCRCL
jgi:hypothetical protein